SRRGYRRLVSDWSSDVCSSDLSAFVSSVPQTVTQVSAPSGTLLTNADPYVLGNRGAGDRGWSGVLDDMRIYDAALTTAQINTDRSEERGVGKEGRGQVGR